MILFETIQFTVYGHIVYISIECFDCLRIGFVWELFLSLKKTWPEKSTIHCVVSILYEDKILKFKRTII